MKISILLVILSASQASMAFCDLPAEEQNCAQEVQLAIEEVRNRKASPVNSCPLKAIIPMSDKPYSHIAIYEEVYETYGEPTQFRFSMVLTEDCEVKNLKNIQ